jgi:hypothetical protein
VDSRLCPRRNQAPVEDIGTAPISCRAMISSAPTIAEWSQGAPPCAAHALNNSCHRRVGRADPHLARRRKGEVEILLVQLNAETGVECALDHSVAV